MTLAPGARPQTLRQAKRAYRKSSAKPKLSAAEIAMAERRAVLQERADRIKERELRRKANLRKKEERKEAERERERLMKAGGKELGGPQTRGFKVGASQLDLVRFLPGGKHGLVGKGGDGLSERRGGLGRGEEGGDGARRQGNRCCDRWGSDRDLKGLEGGEEEGLRSQPDVEKKGVSFDMFDDGDEQEGQQKSELECQPESDGGKEQYYDTGRSSCGLGAGTPNHLHAGDPQGVLNETQQRRKLGRDLDDEIRPKIPGSSPSLLREHGIKSGKRLRLETDSIKPQSMSGCGSVEQVKQTESRNTHLPDKKQPTSASSRRSPLKERCTNSVQRPNFEDYKASKAMRPPPPPRLSPTMAAITSFDDDFFPSNTQVEREISPCPPKKHQTISMKSPMPQAKMMPIPQPLPEDSHDFLAYISTQDLDFSGMFTQMAPSRTTRVPPDTATPPQPQQSPQQDSITNGLTPQQVKNEPSRHDHHQQKPPSTPSFTDTLPVENDLLANISTPDLFSSQPTLPNSPPPSPPPKSLPTSSTTNGHPSSQFPSHVPPPPPRPKISAAAGPSISFDLDDEDGGFTADDLATIAVQVELAMSGSSASTAASARGDEG